jgi:hypothetical protein
MEALRAYGIAAALPRLSYLLTSAIEPWRAVRERFGCLPDLLREDSDACSTSVTRREHR